MRQILLALVVFTGAMAVSAEPYRFTTIAGSYPSAEGSKDGPAADARFQTPWYLAVDTPGNVYVSDTWNATVRKITPAGVVSTIGGAPRQFEQVDGEIGKSRFYHPKGIVVDGNGTVFVVAGYAIRKISPTGVASLFVGIMDTWGTLTDGDAKTARFLSPSGLAMDVSGNLYVVDSGTYIRKVTPAGFVTTLAGNFQGFTNRIQQDGTGSSALFENVEHITADKAGNLYVTDGGTTVRKISPTGVVTTIAGQPNQRGITDGVGRNARFWDAHGITIDAEGWLYVAAEAFSFVRKISPAGIVSTLVRRPTGRYGPPNLFDKPTGICVSATGDLYVADYSSRFVAKVTPAGVVSSIAGRPYNTGAMDGLGAGASFYSPHGIAGDSKGNLYVADVLNSLIRRIATDGRVTTFAGTRDSIRPVTDAGRAVTLLLPTGIYIDASDYLFVTDDGEHNVRRITPTGAVTTIAGSISGASGTVDGRGTNARFKGPHGVTQDRAGNTYVCETAAYVVRKIAADGTVTTIAGKADVSGHVDGPGGDARFIYPSEIVANRAGDLFVADGDTVRKISFENGIPTVSTFAGTSDRRFESVDGIGRNARFASLVGIAIDAQENLFVTDYRYIRKIAPNGAVTTIGGNLELDTFDGVGSEAYFILPRGLWVSPEGTLYIVDGAGNRIVKGELATAPTIIAQPRSGELVLGAAATLYVEASGAARYQWRLDGAVIPGATQATYSLSSVAVAHAGTYTVEVSNPSGTATSAVASLRVSVPGHMINFSVLAHLASAGESFSLGTVLGGAGTAGSKPVLIRAVGPSLERVGVVDAVAAARLELFAGTLKIAENAAWGGDPQLALAMAQVGAFAFANGGSRDAAIHLADGTGANRSVRISATTPGFVLAELYDTTPVRTLTATTPRLTNLSILKEIKGGFVAGFTIGGSTSATVLIRAVGPTLTSFGVAGALADPKLEVFDSNSAVIATNSGWGGGATLSSAFRSTGAFSLDASSKDSAALVTLPPGNYTVHVTSVTGSQGTALAEIYEVR
ncbi:MAG: hypothetical protein V4773_02935 [Verrucomicrobiota bacterium]